MVVEPTPAEALRAALPGDVGVLDARQVSAALGLVKEARGVLDAFEAKLTSRITALHTRGESAPAADVHTRDGGASSKEAQHKERRAKTLDDAPSLADKLDAGEATAGHADALTDALHRLDDDTRRRLLDLEADLAADAARMTPDEFRRSCRQLIRQLERDQGIERDRRQRRETRVTTTIDRDGMYVLNARMHPEMGSAVFNMLDAETRALVKQGGDRSVDRAQVRAEALSNLITGGHQAVRPHEAEILVVTPVESLVDDTTTGGELGDGTPLPTASVRRLLCNGRIVPIIVDTNGVVLDAGREQRLANRAQRRALRAMYRTCAFHGCEVEFARCEIHHIVPFEVGGATDLAGLLPLCSRHHHVVHDLGWRLELDGDRTLTIRQRDGTLHAVIPLESNRPAASADASTRRDEPRTGERSCAA